MKLRTHSRLLLAALVLGLVLQPLAAFAAPAWSRGAGMTAAAVLPLDADDDYPTAPVAPVTPITGDLTELSDDWDIYSIALDAGDKVTFQLTMPVGADFSASIVSPDPDYEYVAEDFGDGTSYVVPASGTYYFEIYTWAGSGAYSLTYTIGTAEADDLYPGIAAVASPITGSLGGSDSIDYHYLTLAAGQHISFTGTGDADTDFYPFLVGPEGFDDYRAEPNAEEYPYTASYTVPPGDGGTYAIAVESYGGTGDYSVSYTISASAPPRVYESISGDNRFATAIEASKKAFPTGAPCVVIATGENWPDALGGAALAAANGGPILLTHTASLTPTVKTEIQRLGATKAFVLGGSQAVSVATFNAVKAIIPNTTRIAGNNRYQTAEGVARRVISMQGEDFGGACFITTGANFPDALGASPVSASSGMPILLSPPSGITPGVASLIEASGIEAIAILGGEKALPSSALEPLDGLELMTLRLAGSTRYETAAKVAAFGHDEYSLTYDKVAVATGANFPDALAAGAMQAVDGSLMLLTPSTTLDPYAKAALAANKYGINTVRFLGGAKALTTTVRSQVKATVGP